MARIEHIKDYRVKSGDSFFFDNNVWMLLFSSAVSNSRLRDQQIYGSLFRDIQSAGATIFTNALVASEYVNTNLRLGFSRWQREPGNSAFNSFKLHYRPTEAFRNWRDVVYAELGDILRVSFRKPDDFNAIEPTQLLDATGETMDFNDAYFVAYCKLNNLILVTDDRDMFDTPLDLTILTK